MKNYLVGALRPVLDTWGPWKGAGPNENWQRDLDYYTEMYELSRRTAGNFLAGEWETVVFRSAVLDVRQFCIAQWYAIKELWHQEPCNILWMGSDTMFVQPTEIFGVYDKMKMFNYTDPRGIADIPHYFNDDVRYYPATMDPEVWNVGERLMRQWYDHAEVKWDLGQMIHNYQYWSQPMAADTVFDPRFNWLAHGIRDITPENIAHHEEWNRCPLNQAKIVHFSGSRGGEAAVKIMRDFVKYLNLDI
jgi:hypothetical protein